MKTKFEPSRPSGDDSKNGKWSVTQLNEKLLLDVAERVSVRKQDYATKGAHRGKHQCCKVRLHTVGFHEPLKNPEHDHEKHSGSMLENVGGEKALREDVWAGWPVLRIGTKAQKNGEDENGQGPHLHIR